MYVLMLCLINFTICVALKTFVFRENENKREHERKKEGERGGGGVLTGSDTPNISELLVLCFLSTLPVSK